MTSLGPQHERLSEWVLNQDTTFDLGIPSNEREPLAQPSSAFVSQLKKLQAENDHIKDYAKRLEVELNKFQIRYPNESIVLANTVDQPNLDSETPPWIHSSTYASPLFTAYDARIAELQVENDKCKAQLKKMETLQRDLEAENLKLAADMENLLSDTIAQTDQAPSLGGGIPNNASTETIRELHEQLELLLKENSTLTEEVTIMEAEQKRMEMSLKENLEENAQLSAAFQSAASALKQTQDQVKVLQVEKEFCESTIKTKTQENAQIGVDLSNTQHALEAMQEECKRLATQLAEQKQFVEELNDRAFAEGEFLEQQSLVVTTRSKELKSELEFRERELDTLRDAHRTLKLEHDKTRQDCEGMIQVIAGLEKQIVEYAAREEANTKLVHDAEERKEQAILEREQMSTRAQQVSRELERLSERVALQDKSDTRLKDERLTELEAKYKQTINNLEHEIAELLKKNADVAHDMGRAKRDAKQAEDNFEALKGSVNEEKQRLVRQIEEAAAVLQEKEAQLQREESDLLATKQAMLRKQHDLQVERERYSVKISNQESQLATLKHQLDGARESEKVLVRDLKTKSEKLDQLTHQVNMDKETWDAKMVSMKKSYEHRVTSLTHDLEETDAELKRTKELLRRNQQLIEQGLEERGSQQATERQFHKKVMEEAQQECTRLRQRNSVISQSLEQMQQQAQTLLTEKRLTESKISQLTTALGQSSRQLQDAKLQIAEFLEKEQQHFAQIKQLKIEVSHLELEQERVRRWEEKENRKQQGLERRAKEVVQRRGEGSG